MRAVLAVIAIAGMAQSSLCHAARLCRIPTAAGLAHGDTCTPLTEELLYNLRFATKQEVLRTLGGPGGRLTDGLHYESFADKGGSYSGVVNFAFEDQKVVLISALLRPHNFRENNGQSLMYIWSSDPTKHSCSDFEGSTQRCTFPT